MCDLRSLVYIISARIDSAIAKGSGVDLPPRVPG